MTLLQLKKAVQKSIDENIKEIYINWISPKYGKDVDKNKKVIADIRKILDDNGYKVDVENVPQQTWKKS